jgi:hypothetical protein
MTLTVVTGRPQNTHVIDCRLVEDAAATEVPRLRLVADRQAIAGPHGRQSMGGGPTVLLQAAGSAEMRGHPIEH